MGQPINITKNGERIYIIDLFYCEFVGEGVLDLPNPIKIL